MIGYQMSYDKLHKTSCDKLMMRLNVFAKAVGRFAMCLLALPLCMACSNDPYSTGDGALSYMRADFVEAQTDASANVCSAVTDDGVSLSLSPKLKTNWTSVADTTYRALLYYSVADGVEGQSAVKAIALTSVAVPTPVDAESRRLDFPTDPVTVSSMWLSKNLRYINIDLSLKIGEKDGKLDAQTLGVAYQGREKHDDGTSTHRLAVVHSQNGVPQYYSYETYMSVPLYRMPHEVAPGDEVEIEVNTYGGKLTRTFRIE